MHPYSKQTQQSSLNLKTEPAQNLRDLKYKIGLIHQMPAQARFFQMKAYQWSAIKAGIVYGTWSTSIDLNIQLDQAYREAKGKYPIILFFSVNQSKSFQGVAIMKSRVNPQLRQDVWDDTKKFQGLFMIEWIYVQHILSTEFKGILNSLNKNKPVINQRNGQEINYEAGIQMLEIFKVQSQQKQIEKDYIWNSLINLEDTEEVQQSKPQIIHSQQYQHSQFQNPTFYLPIQSQIKYETPNMQAIQFIPSQNPPFSQDQYQQQIQYYPYPNYSQYQPQQQQLPQYLQPFNFATSYSNNISYQQFPPGQQIYQRSTQQPQLYPNNTDTKHFSQF